MEPRILLAIDLPERVPAVVAGTAALAERLGASRLDVAHVLDPKRLSALEDERPKEARFVDVILRERAEQVEQQLLDTFGEDGPEVDVHVLEGEPALAILEAATRASYDYLVIGVRSRSRVGKLLLGSTSQAVLLGSPCPVVAIPI